MELRKKVFFISKNFPYTDEFVQIFLRNYNPLIKIKEYFKRPNFLEVVIINENIKFKLTKETKALLDIFLI